MGINETQDIIAIVCLLYAVGEYSEFPLQLSEKLCP